MKVWNPSDQEIKISKEWGTWSKEVSEFPWTYSEKETCFIIEGEAEVIDDSGNTIHFKAGDMVTFESGLKCTWKIKRDLRKHYTFG